MSNMKYKDAALPVKERVEDLVHRMTLEEKIAQLIGDIFPYGKKNFPVQINEKGELIKSEKYVNTIKHGLGGIAYINFSLEPEESVQFTNALQKDAIENTRLGIPLLIFEECIYGQISEGSTRFPFPIGLAATWDPELTQSVFNAIGREVRTRGGNMTMNPVLDLGRDPRWGRIQETFGEDTYLASRLGVAAVKGLQGGDEVTSTHIAATLKHFAGFGQSQGGRQLAPGDIPYRVFIDEILPAFQRVVMEANPAGVMGAYHEVDGVPCHANKWLIHEMLREKWGFQGVFLSDFGGINKLTEFHNVTENLKEAAELALLTGVDMDLQEGVSYRELLNQGELSNGVREAVDRSVRRVLELKFKLGLFDKPYVELQEARSTVWNEKHRQIAQKVAEECLVLLKNENNILPLNVEKVRKIAVIGPHSKLMDFGVTIYDGIKSQFPENTEILWAQGCALTDQDEILPYLHETQETNFTELHKTAFHLDDELHSQNGRIKPKTLSPEVEKNIIQEAVGIAKECDVIVLCLGESEKCCGENYAPSRFCDRHSLELIGNQLALLDALKAINVPIVTVLIHGRPLELSEVSIKSDALISAFLPGEGRGTAVAKALLGRINPGGRLPVTMPVSAGHIPCYYSQRPTSFTREYAFSEGRYVYPFGYGLSYTRFEYQNMKVVPETLEEGDRVEVTVDVENVGEVDGDEVVQLYIRDNVASLTRPASLLKGFKRVRIKAGETRKLTFQLRREDMAFTNVRGDFVCEPGEFTIFVGSSSRKRDLIESRIMVK